LFKSITAAIWSKFNSFEIECPKRSGFHFDNSNEQTASARPAPFLSHYRLKSELRQYANCFSRLSHKSAGHNSMAADAKRLFKIFSKKNVKKRLEKVLALPFLIKGLLK